MPEAAGTLTGGTTLTPMILAGAQEGGRGMTVKEIKKQLVKQHKKTTGRRSTLLKRLRSKRGGDDDEVDSSSDNGEEVGLGDTVMKHDENDLTGGRHKKLTKKQKQKILKKHGMKTTGTNRAITMRMKKAKLL